MTTCERIALEPPGPARLRPVPHPAPSIAAVAASSRDSQPATGPYL